MADRPYYLCTTIRSKNRQANTPPPKSLQIRPFAWCQLLPSPHQLAPRQWCQPWGCQEACCHANNPGWEGAMEMGDWSSS